MHLRKGQTCRTCCKKIVPHNYDERMSNRDEKALLKSLYVNSKLIDNAIVTHDTTWHEKVNYLAKQPEK